MKREWRLWLPAALALCCIALSASRTDAQVWARLKTMQLEVHHYSENDQKVYVKNGKGQTEDSAPLRSGQVFDVGRDTEVQITIGDPNPLLYEYRWKGITSVNTPEYDAIIAFATALKASGLGSGAAPTAVPLPSAPDDYVKNLKTALSAIQKMAETVESTVRLSIVDPQKAKSTGLENTAKLEDSANAIQEGYKKLREIRAKLISTPADNNSASDLALRADVALLMTYEPETKSLVAELETFRAALRQIGMPLLLGTVPYGPTQQQTATFEIVASSSAKIKDPNSKKRALGAYNFVVYPRSPIRISLAPAMIHSWAKGNDAEPVGTKVAALLNFTPRQWEGPVVGFGWHVGVGADSKMPSFFFGLSMYATIVHFGGGFTYQDTVKENTKFKPGGYLLISVDLASLKK